MTKLYLYRRGDGNEGNLPRNLVALRDTECPFAALHALVVNDCIPGRSRRRWIAKNLEVDGEAEYGVSACISYGPRGEQAFESAWLTAELEPLTEDEAKRWADNNPSRLPTAYFLNRLLDRGAMGLFRKLSKG